MVRKQKQGSDESRVESGAIAPRRPVVIALWLVFLAVVLFVITNILPIGAPSSPGQTRRGKRIIERGAEMEREGLWLSAVQAYESVMQNERVNRKLRSESAERAARIHVEHLDDPEAGRAALETAYFFASEEKEKIALRAKLTALENAASSPAYRGLATVIAKIGAEEVSLEDIRYGWNRVYGDTEPSVDALEKFAEQYIDNVYLAAEADRRGMKAEPAHAMELRFYERQMLVQALLRVIAPAVDDEDLLRHYEANKTRYMKPGAVRGEHIVVETEEESAEVGKRLEAGESFESLATTLSLDRDELPGGSDIGWLEAEDDFIPYLGMAPGLSSRLVLHDEGYTTGPIQSPRGFHWIRVAARREPQPQAFEEVRDSIGRDLIRSRFDEAKESLLAELKNSIPSEYYEQAIAAALKRAEESEGGEPEGAPSQP